MACADAEGTALPTGGAALSRARGPGRVWAWGRGEGPAVGCIFDEIVFQGPYRDLVVRVGCAFDEIVFQEPYRDLVVPVGGGSSLCGCTLAGSAPTLN